MKATLLSLVAVLVCTLSAVADEYGYFTQDEGGVFSQVSLGAGDRLVVLASGSPSSDSGKIMMVDLPSGDAIELSPATLGLTQVSTGGWNMNHSFASGNELDRTFVGPCTVYPKTTTTKCYIAYKITRASDNSIKPANVISLPADPDGDMQLVFESSDDLLTWTQQFSFTHSSSNSTSKFFRTRLIQGAGE